MRKLILAFFLLLGCASPAAAQTVGQTIWTRGSGQWEVMLERHVSDGYRCRWQTWWHEGGRPVRYMAFVVRPSGIALILNAAHGHYPLDAIEGRRVGVVVDGIRYSGVVDYTSVDRIATVASMWVARNSNVRRFVEDFARSNRAAVELPGGAVWVAGLTGTMASLPIMLGCLEEADQRNRR